MVQHCWCAGLRLHEPGQLFGRRVLEKCSVAAICVCHNVRARELLAKTQGETPIALPDITSDYFASFGFP